MPATLTYGPVPFVLATARTQLATRRRHARCAETHPVPPLKGLGEPCAASVSYRALFPDWEPLPSEIKGGLFVLSQPTANYSLLTANSSFTFSAKERDPETGLSYFGSRYYSSDLSIWLSVDPMSDKYASLSPYVYCANNPVRLVDPNGESIWIAGDDGQTYEYRKDGELYLDGKKINSMDEFSLTSNFSLMFCTCACRSTGRNLTVRSDHGF